MKTMVSASGWTVALIVLNRGHGPEQFLRVTSPHGYLTGGSGNNTTIGLHRTPDEVRQTLGEAEYRTLTAC